MKPKLNQSVNSEVGADRRLKKAPSSNEGRIQELVDHINEHGYVVLPNIYTQAEMEEAKAEVSRLEEAHEATRGRNTFEGEKTDRIYALANKTRAFDKFALHPDVLALNDHFLDPGYLLNSFQIINIKHGETPQTLHHDDGYVMIPRPHRPFGTVR